VNGGRRLEAHELASVFHALGNATRLRLLEFVLREARCVTRCVEEIGLSQSGVSKHLAQLARAGLVESRPRGRRTYYRVRDPERVEELLRVTRGLRNVSPSAP
jgi:DNA-binding transcriptional ArsR family regulator